MNIGEFVQNLADSWLNYLAGIVALSAVTMAILQTAKDLLPIRRAFQRRFLRRWIARKCQESGDVESIEASLIDLATDGEVHAFYDLPIEQLCGQIAAASQIALDFPAQHEKLLRCLAARAPRHFLDELIHAQPSMRVAFEELQRRDSAESRAQLEQLAEAKARVTHQIQRNIDALQIAATYQWKFGFQIASFVLSFVLALVATSSSTWPWATRLFVALSSGFLAPIARDLQARLQQVK